MKIKFTNKWRALWRAGFFYTLLFVSTVKFDLMILKNFNTLQTVVSPTSLQQLFPSQPDYDSFSNKSPTMLIAGDGRGKASLVASKESISHTCYDPFGQFPPQLAIFSLALGNLHARYPFVGMLLSFFFFLYKLVIKNILLGINLSSIGGAALWPSCVRVA